MASQTLLPRMTGDVQTLLKDPHSAISRSPQAEGVRNRARQRCPDGYQETFWHFLLSCSCCQWPLLSSLKLLCSYQGQQRSDCRKSGSLQDWTPVLRQQPNFAHTEGIGGARIPDGLEVLTVTEAPRVTEVTAQKASNCNCGYTKVGSKGGSWGDRRPSETNLVGSGNKGL